LRLIGTDSLQAARWLNAVYAMFALAAFYGLRRAAWHDDASAATLQAAVLPILFALDFLVYTDVLSLALVLASAACALRGRNIATLGLCVAAISMRQSNVVWLPLLAGLATFRTAPLLLRLPPWRQLVARNWPYLVVLGGFLTYWKWNGHIALGQSFAHPDWSFHAGNLYFALFLFALLLPFQLVAGLRDFAVRAQARPWLWTLPAIALSLYWCFFRVDHPANMPNIYERVLHNEFANWTQANEWARAVFGLIAAAAICALFATRLRPVAAYLFFPSAAVLLVASWMIEQRYALIPFTLWLAFRERRSAACENATLLWWAAGSITLCLGLFRGWFKL